jgi:hypothetical protein
MIITNFPEHYFGFMLYYTQMIFLKEGQENVFNAFEAHVLPLLRRHNGELLYRVRPEKSAVIATSWGYPYEIHLVSFLDRADFEAYRDDKERIQYLPLKNQSVERILLIEGSLL